MTWKEYRNLLLSLALCLLSMLCIRILPSAFLWELVDAESFFRAQMLFLAAAFTAMLGVFLLEAGLLMLRFTMLSLVKGRIFSKVLSVLLVLGHGICIIVNVSLLIAGIAGIVLNGADRARAAQAQVTKGDPCIAFPKRKRGARNSAVC